MRTFCLVVAAIWVVAACVGSALALAGLGLWWWALASRPGGEGLMYFGLAVALWATWVSVVMFYLGQHGPGSST